MDILREYVMLLSVDAVIFGLSVAFGIDSFLFWFHFIREE